MGYREKCRMEIVELVRRWQAGEADRRPPCGRQRARQTGMARATVGKYLTAAQALGVERSGAPPTEAQLGRLGQLSQVVGVASPPAPHRSRRRRPTRHLPQPPNRQDRRPPWSEHNLPHRIIGPPGGLMFRGDALA